LIAIAAIKPNRQDILNRHGRGDSVARIRPKRNFESAGWHRHRQSV